MELLNKHVVDFLTVANAGSFSRAARERGVSQPALSQSVRLLERELGRPLLEREQTGVELTAAGRALREAAEQARGILAEAVRERTALHVGVNAESCGVVTGAVGPVFKQKNPLVDLHVHDIVGNSTLELGLDAGCDLVEAAEPESLAPDTSFIPCTFQRLVLCAPPGHPLTQIGRPCTLSDLRGQTMLLFRRGVLSCNDRMLDEIEGGGYGIDVVLADDRSYTDLDLVVNGWFSPSLEHLAVRRAPLVAVPFEPVQGMLVGLAYRGELTESARLFAELAQASFGEY